MAGCAKVYLLDLRQIARVLRGEARVRNLPADAEIVALHVEGNDLGLRVHSASFPPSAHGERLPVVSAVLNIDCQA